MTYFLPRVVGPSRALEMLLEDPNMSAADALAERLVRRGGAGDELMERARPEGREARPRWPRTTCAWRRS
jgi:enoyl-CoA hydratase/carnithine racemase